MIRRFHLQSGGVHLSGATDIILPLFFPAEKAPFTALLGRQELFSTFWRARHGIYLWESNNKAGRRSSRSAEKFPACMVRVRTRTH